MVKLFIKAGYKTEPLNQEESKIIELALKRLRTDFLRHKGLTSEDEYFINIEKLMAKLKIF